MKELDAERVIHSRAIEELKNELKITTSQKNYKLGKLISELYSVKQDVKKITKELEDSQTSRASEGSIKEMEAELLVHKETATVLKNAIETVVSEKNNSVEELNKQLSSEREIKQNLEKVIQELKNEKNELQNLYNTTKDELEKKSENDQKMRDEALSDLKKNADLKEEKLTSLHDQLSRSKKDFDDLVKKYQGYKSELESNVKKELTQSEEKLIHLKLEYDINQKDALKKQEDLLKEDFASQLTTILNEKDELQSTLGSVRTDLENLTQSHNELRKEKLELEKLKLKETASFKENNSKLREEKSVLEEKVQNLLSETSAIQSQLEACKKDHDAQMSEYKNEAYSLSQVREGLKKVLMSNDLKTDDMLLSLSQHFENFHRVSEKLYEYETEIESLKQSVEAYEIQTTELISKKVENDDDKINEIKQDMEKKLTELAEEKGKEIWELKSQIAKQHSRKDSVIPDNFSEVASTCSISRSDEQNRLADCEGYFEERYAKLKILAVKLKKRVAELEALRKADKDKLLATNNNMSNIQSAFDELGEEVQAKKSFIKVVESDLKKSVEDLVLSKQKILELQEDLNLANTNNQALKNNLSETENMFTKLNKDFSELKQKDESSQGYILELKKTVDSYHEKEEILENAKSLDTELETNKKELKELRDLSDTKEQRIEVLESELEQKTKAKNHLEVQLKTLESSLQDETDNSEEIQKKLSDCSRQLSSCELQLTEKNSELSELREKVQNLTAERDFFQSKLQNDSLLAAEETQVLRLKNDSLQKKVSTLEEEVRRKDDSFKEMEASLKDLQNEFSSYKLRAQSVLRQSKSTTSKDSESQSNENKSIENSQYERTIQHLNEKIETLRNKLASSDMDKNHLQEDHDRLMQRHSSLLEEMAAKEIAARNKHEELVNTINQTESSLEELSIQHKIKAEEKAQYYENEIQQIGSKHFEDISKLQKQIDDLDNKNIMLHLSLQEQQNLLASSSVIQSKDSSPMLEREAPEGSVEQTSGMNSRQSPAISQNESMRDHSPMPLEKLLESVQELEESKVLEKTIIVKDEEAIRSLEKKISHLSGLLSDSESENHRMFELIEVLKEEIRSYRRSEDRIKHIEHQEYVKNVILKFVTMSNCDEKKQLLPIVSKLLVLSPSEIKTIEATMDNDPLSEGVDQSSWPSYFGFFVSTDP
uniref:Golgin subfamily B member 1like [Aplysia californica] n=2 Tax=Lepeophtheirus salmonis TaxID=72036 RepID=A0A0K2TZJ3_LEPSM